MAYTNIRPEDLSFSGPKVWPKITAERMSDIFIHRRPELAYLEALRRKAKLEGEKDPVPDILVTVSYRMFDNDEKMLGTKSKASKNVWHHIKQDRTEDVRKLLLELREVLETLLPLEPNPMIGVVVLYSCEINWKQALARFQSRWI